MASEAPDLTGLRQSEISTELASQWRRLTRAAFWRTIVLKHDDASDDLVTHELCHIWQGQHRAWHVIWSWATTRYARNPYELEARRAVHETSRT